MRRPVPRAGPGLSLLLRGSTLTAAPGDVAGPAAEQQEADDQEQHVQALHQHRGGPVEDQERPDEQAGSGDGPEYEVKNELQAGQAEPLRPARVVALSIIVKSHRAQLRSLVDTCQLAAASTDAGAPASVRRSSRS